MEERDQLKAERWPPVLVLVLVLVLAQVLVLVLDKSEKSPGNIKKITGLLSRIFMEIRRSVEG